MPTMTPLQVYAALAQLPTLAQAKANILAICQAAALPVMSWIFGSPSERWIEVAARAMDAWGVVPAQAVKGFILELATDPGDPGDASPDQTPRFGWLSALGQGWFFTTRGAQTYATSTVTITNPGSSPISFAPYQITVERSAPGSDGGAVTYRNQPSPGQYTNVNGTLTLSGGASVALPFQADQLGSYASASVNAITIVQTQTYGMLTATASTVAVGLDRETASAYVARCLQQADSLSPGGPTNAYLRAMTTDRLGNPLINYSTGAPVNITQAYVSPSSSTGLVTIYYGTATGPASQGDVSSANANITGIPLGLVTAAIVEGCLPDTVGIGPAGVGGNPVDPNTGNAGGVPATQLTMNVQFTALIPAALIPGGAAKGSYPSTGFGAPPVGSGLANIFAAIQAQATAFLPSQGIGGMNQTAGAGFVYTDDLLGTISAAAPGLFGVVVTAPAGGMGSTTALAIGQMAVIGTFYGIIQVV